jgi:hypothetical protein
MKYLIAWLLHRFNLTPQHLFFHRQFANKTCPGKRLNLDDIRIVVAKTLPEAIERYEQILKEGET